MHPRLIQSALVLGIVLVSSVFASGVQVRFDPSSQEVGPFPSDALTVADWGQKTGRRISLPLPDCAAQASACAQVQLLNEYDGFSPNPRMRVRFSAPVDLQTLRQGVFLIALENLTSEEAGTHYAGTAIPINQLIWDPATNSLFAKPDNVLDQHRRYALIVTGAVRDMVGDPVEADPAFLQCLSRPGNAYCGDLANHLAVWFLMSERLGGSNRIVAASIFTTLSATSWLEKARDQLPLTPPEVRPAGPRSVFNTADIASVVFRQHTGVNPPAFNNTTAATRLAGIRALAFGSYRSPNYLVLQEKRLWPPNRFRMIASTPTSASLPPPAATEEVHFHVAMPDAHKPADGYPVVIFGHGSPGNKFAYSISNGVAQSIAAEGYAIIAINLIGHGFGPEGKLVITEKNGAVTEIPAGGRAVDVNGSGTFGSSEGCELYRDCVRQSALDLVQLVKAIQAGIDLDGDGSRDLNPDRIFFQGFDLGANVGAPVAAVEPAVSAAVLNVAGASLVDTFRWSPLYGQGFFQGLFGGATPPIAPNAGTRYDDDYVLRDQPVKTIGVQGALELQEYVEMLDWITAPGDSLHYAAHLRASTLPGVPIKRVLFQVGRGDQGAPNPTSSALIRAAQAPDWAVLYRHDLARAAFPELVANPRSFLITYTTAASSAVSVAAGRQVARFFSTGERCSLLDACIPDMSDLLVPVFGRNLFEIPTVLPEDLGFLAP